MTTSRTPEKPLASELARNSIMARTTSCRQRLTHSHGVGAQQIHLQLANIAGRDAHIAELANAGVDGVCDPILFQQAFYYGAGLFDGLAGTGFEQNRTVFIHHVAHVGEGQVVSVDMECFQSVCPSGEVQFERRR